MDEKQRSEILADDERRREVEEERDDDSARSRNAPIEFARGAASSYFIGTNDKRDRRRARRKASRTASSIDVDLSPPRTTMQREGESIDSSCTITHTRARAPIYRQAGARWRYGLISAVNLFTEAIPDVRRYRARLHARTERARRERSSFCGNARTIRTLINARNAAG